ncbi:hypothetical protein M5689_014510 [Euphorbia peplus]|nr:hypothetical protein M5689_014510 [Euphorbia peplus]
MSRTSGGGGGGGKGGAARVKIPESVRQTILSIREITGKQHSDEDIYSVLQDCSMDPNDTTQKLLYLDTFHEVKRKRDKKKEISVPLSRGARSGRGNHSAKNVYPDGAGGRNAVHRENGVYQKTERGSSNLLPVKERVKGDAAVPETKASTLMPNGPSTLINGSPTGCVPHSASGKDANLIHDISDDDAKKPSTLSLLPAVPSSAPNQMSESVVQAQKGSPISTTIPASLSGVYSSASDPVLPPSTARNPGAVGAIKREVRIQPTTVEQNHIPGNKHISPEVESELPKNEKTASTIIYTMNEKSAPGNSKVAEMNELSETPKHSLPAHNSLLGNVPASAVDDSLLSKESDVPLKVVSSEDAQTERSSILLPEQTIANGHVIFPDHFKVPEALKSGLTFGSFDSKSGSGSKHSNGEVNSAHVVGSSHENDELAREPSSSDQSISSTLVDHVAEQLESAQVFDKVPKPESDAAATPDSTFDKPAQEIMLISEGHQNPTVQIAPNYGYGIMPMQAGHFVQFEGHEIQARDVSRLSGFVNENPTTSSSPSPSPSPTPPVQNPVAASPQPILFRPPYPPNYFPYGHYYNPYFLPPMHQFLTHNGLPQQPSPGNAYLGPTAAAQGVKFPVPQYKPGTSTGNPTPIGLQSLYGSYGGSPPIAFNPGPPATSGNSASNEDLSASQLKESQIYATGPLNDVSAWISAGQDVSNLHLNSLYHMTPQGQHLAFSPAQPGHGPFPGIYAPVQTIAAPATVNPLLQQTQGLSAGVETVGHPAGAYQQNQLAQMNWNAATY